MEFFFPAQIEVIKSNHESGGVKVSAFQLSLRADISERGEHCGPQLLAKLVSLLSVRELFGLFLG